MIRCLLFGHEPHPTFAQFYAIPPSGADESARRATFCTRCGEPVWAVTTEPRPADFITPEETHAVLIDSLIDRLRVELLPNLMKARIPRKTAEPTESGEG